ncbi:FMN-dependent NADH-azoreductase, partial [Klebsiella pneumoniae]|nr:FMN-dependent NADH-azoreductase [Klebsiella pneumoniae]
GLMGIQEVEFIYAEGLDNRPHGRDAGIASARAQIARLAVPA